MTLRFSVRAATAASPEAARAPMTARRRQGLLVGGAGRRRGLAAFWAAEAAAPASFSTTPSSLNMRHWRPGARVERRQEAAAHRHPGVLN